MFKIVRNIIIEERYEFLQNKKNNKLKMFSLKFVFFKNEKNKKLNPTTTYNLDL